MRLNRRSLRGGDSCYDGDTLHVVRCHKGAAMTTCAPTPLGCTRAELWAAIEAYYYAESDQEYAARQRVRDLLGLDQER